MRDRQSKNSAAEGRSELNGLVGWRPIETAPMDGNPLLGFRDNDYSFYVMRCYYPPPARKR